jgi:HAE1 family hydrophobic/amphiphilic exporter-1
VARTLPFDFYRQSDTGEISVLAKFPIGTPLPVTDQLTQRIERRLAEHPDVRVVHATVGGGLLGKTNEASLYVKITPKEERDRSQVEVMRELREILIALVPEARSLAVSHMEWSEGMGRGRTAALQYTLRGPELDRLQGYAAELSRRMKADPSFTDVDTSFESGRPEITLEIDRERAGDLGVPVMGIGRTIRTLIAGEKAGSFEESGRRYDVRVQILPEYRDDPAKLDLIRVRSLRGELVPITNVARPREGEGPVEIHRENRVRQITLYANLAAGAPLGTGTAKLERWGREIGIAQPDELVATGRARAMRETGQALVFALGLALLSIYMILASLFNSLVHPFTIMMSAPLSWIGGFLALKLAGMSLDLMSGIGLLVLMGLVMKNGILLVDKTNQLREEGKGLEDALLEAGPARMRPVLMTTGALIFGLLPVALGANSGSEFRAPMGMITVGGLATSTLLTLVVVPVVYAVLDGASTRSASLVRRLLRRTRAQASTAR